MTKMPPHAVPSKLRWSIALVAAFACITPCCAFGEDTRLKSGQRFVTQSWSQETDFRRPYFVNVPNHRDGESLPLLIFLHGNGGNAKSTREGFLKRLPQLSQRFVTVFPNGYLKSWNIVSERSKADDRGFIETIIETLTAYPNVRDDNVSVMGSSNGAALVNQLAIETRRSNIRNFVTCVSPLNTFQFDGTNFKAKGDNNEYLSEIVPLAGKRLMNVSGTEDRLVPYRGGASDVIPAKDGKLSFLDAEETIYRWAEAIGYTGPKLESPTRSTEKIEVFSYLDGNVVHYKLLGEGHGATRAIGEDVLLSFLTEP